MSETMKRAHELAPFVADALRAVAEEADYPDGKDSREWIMAEREAHMLAVDIADALLSGGGPQLGEILSGSILAHAELDMADERDQLREIRWKHLDLIGTLQDCVASTSQERDRYRALLERALPSIDWAELMGVINSRLGADIRAALEGNDED